MMFFDLFIKSKKGNNISSNTIDYTLTNVVYSTINTTHSKARFEDGKVYWISNNGEILIGYYEDQKIYNSTRNEIGRMSANGRDIFVQLCSPNTTKVLHVNANADGYIEEVCGEYRNIAYLQNRSTENAFQSIIGLAAAFVCLQSEACDNQNEYSSLYAGS